MDTDYSKSDYENVKNIYSALKNLSPSAASDERLWAGLAHGQLWEFVKYRRKTELESKDNQAIQNSFFFMRGKRRSLYIHCLSRLWWTGYLTYDETRKDPYELTKLICENAYASTIMLLSSYNLVSRKDTVIGLLSGLSKIKEKGQVIKRIHFVTVCKYLNNMGAITILDTLDKDQIKNIVEKVLKKEFNIA
nr:DUF6339 family protein [Clostridium beijerinckii]